jgi:hypothetical protein
MEGMDPHGEEFGHAVLAADFLAREITAAVAKLLTGTDRTRRGAF